MRRFTAGLIAFLAFSGVVLVLPVYAETGPEAQPVATGTQEVALGSVAEPASVAEVQEGTSEPVTGVPDTAPALTVSRTGVASFSLVGVTWAYDAAVTDVRVQVRVQDAAGAWGGWTEVGQEDAGADTGQDVTAAVERRGGTAPLWTGPSTGVEVELVTRSGAAPTDVQLDLVDPGTSPADSSLESPDIQDTADAAMDMPDVYSRAQWGADESIMGWDPEYAPTIRAATLHHTADTNNYTADQVPAMMRSIYRYHSVSLGWGDIGYNVIADKFGRLWEGRAGGLSSTVIGAHAGGFNTGTFGVSMLGNYETVDTTPPMVDAVAAIIAWKFSLYGIDPAGTTQLTSRGGGTARYKAGVSVTLPTVFGHRDVGSTACPGKYGYAKLSDIRAKVVAGMPDRAQDMAARHAAAGGTTTLGGPVGPLQTAADVSWQAYEKGRVYWSPATGATVLMNGPLLDRYLAAGGPAGLGAPAADEKSTYRNGGKYVALRGGGIYWSQATGAHVVKGATFDLWARNGWETGFLGYPTTDESNAPGGTYTHFQGGSIYWSPATGAHYVKGAIYDTWARTGYEGGFLGFPTRDETNVKGGTFSLFQGGAVYWSPATGAHYVKGAIYDTWAKAGYEGGVLGFPTRNETNVRGGTFSLFQGGAVYWSPATGAHYVKGAIYDRWALSGYETGMLGFPTSDETNTTGGTSSRFTGGSIYWSPATGARAVTGATYTTYLRIGAERGALGFPTSEARAYSGGTRTEFQRGSITVDALGRATVTTR